jgi:small subunit ribosomal protein S4
MARYRGPRLRIIRRLGELPGLTNKSTIRMNPPGEHGSTKKQGKLSQYGLRLQQLMNYVKQAKAMKGPTGELLLALLEMRLDNIIFRLGFVPTIAAARQLISHGHILVNQQKVDIASYQCQPKDIISVKDKRQSKQLINNYLTDSTNQKTIPVHLSLNGEYLVGIVNNLVDPQFLGLNVNELLIVEYYSRKI